MSPTSVNLTKSLPFMNCVYKFLKSFGIVETMFIRRITDIPFPTPFSVALSPSHITIALPAVRMTTMQNTVQKL